jgi:hypothetical protein
LVPYLETKDLKKKKSGFVRCHGEKKTPATRGNPFWAPSFGWLAFSLPL